MRDGGGPSGVGIGKECHIVFVLSHKCLRHSWKIGHSVSPLESCFFSI